MSPPDEDANLDALSRADFSPGRMEGHLWYRDATGEEVVRRLTGDWSLTAESHPFQIWVNPEHIKPLLLEHFDFHKSRKGHIWARPKRVA